MSNEKNLSQVLKETEQALKQFKIETARLDARMLACHALKVGREELMLNGHRHLSAQDLSELNALVERRAKGEPVSRIIGSRGFWSMDFAIGPNTLDPRPDTETVVEAALEHLPDRNAPYRILDMGTGSGCILLALLSELPNAIGLGTDIALSALEFARVNANENGMGERARFALTSWEDGLPNESFDCVVSNPPYIPTREIHELSIEVSQFDPGLALDGGKDGLDQYRLITQDLSRIMKPDTWFHCEIGAGQEQNVSLLLKEGGLTDLRMRKDLGGHIRCISAQKQGS